MNADWPHLFAPLKIRNVAFRNRIVVSPMCQYSSTDGFANDWHLVHLGTRAVGGAALVFTEATAVTPEGRISPDDLGIWKDEHIEFLSKVTQFIERQGAMPGMQLAHAGRKASTAAPWLGGRPLAAPDRGWDPIFAPSAIPFSSKHQVPQELDEHCIRTVVRAFGDAARRALMAGFRFLEIHAAHGYLLHSFLSPLSNRREDRYGGCFENRTRIVCDVAHEVRSHWPESHPLFLRISATDYVEGGWDLEESVELARRVKLLGVDLVECSSGGLLPQVAIPAGPGYQTPFAQRLKNEAGILTGTVGLITAAEQADHIIRTGQADVVVLARELLRHPYWPLEAARRLGAEAPWPNQYLRAKQ
jgi:2,4-dienoyl-CoA reductase-like NADH-dependent reductase (Old Yellow Enzyme family)